MVRFEGQPPRNLNLIDIREKKITNMMMAEGNTHSDQVMSVVILVAFKKI